MGIRYAEEKKAAAPAAGKLPADYTAKVDGKSFRVQVVSEDTVTVDGKTFKVNVAQGSAQEAPKAGAAASGKTAEVLSPLPGTVVRTSVQVGDAVEAGDELLVIEAMKMETPVKAEKAGTIVEFLVNPKDVITAGQALVVIEEK